MAGADEVGDVLVICGTTLITWAVTDEWVEVPGLWTIPHSTPGRTLIGGPSNAGGLFLNWATHLLGPGRPTRSPDRVPVWSPYVRGERTPLHDPDRRAVLDGLDLTHGPAALRRAAFEAAGFVVRHHLDLAGREGPRGWSLTGGGVRVARVGPGPGRLHRPARRRGGRARGRGAGLGLLRPAGRRPGDRRHRRPALGPGRPSGRARSRPGSSPAPPATSASGSWPTPEPRPGPAPAVEFRRHDHQIDRQNAELDDSLVLAA